MARLSVELTKELEVSSNTTIKLQVVILLTKVNLLIVKFNKNLMTNSTAMPLDRIGYEFPARNPLIESMNGTGNAEEGCVDVAVEFGTASCLLVRFESRVVV